MAPEPTSTARASRRGVLLVGGTILVALNLRFAITSVAPVIDDLRHGLGLSSAAGGLLTTTPLLALGLAAPAAPSLGRRFGPERVVLTSLLMVAAGVALRLPGAIAPLFAGTTLAGCGIAVANVLLPGIIKQRFGDRAPTMMGIYAASLSAGAALATGLTVPIQHAVGGSWATALGLWALPALAAAVVWLPQVRARRGVVSGATRVRPRLWRDPLAWRVTILMGLQSLLFYVVAAWLPDILEDAGIASGAAGLLVACGLVVGIVASPLLAWAANARTDQRGILMLTVVTTAVGLLGVLVAPGSLAAIWVVLLGFGQGGIFALTLTLVVLRSPDADHAAELSSMSQSVGYTLAAAGPLAIGALHDASGSWTLPLVVALVLVIPETIAGLGAARPGQVGAAQR